MVFAVLPITVRMMFHQVTVQEHAFYHNVIRGENQYVPVCNYK